MIGQTEQRPGKISWIEATARSGAAPRIVAYQYRDSPSMPLVFFWIGLLGLHFGHCHNPHPADAAKNPRSRRYSAVFSSTKCAADVTPAMPGTSRGTHIIPHRQRAAAA